MQQSQLEHETKPKDIVLGQKQRFCTLIESDDFFFKDLFILERK